MGKGNISAKSPKIKLDIKSQITQLAKSEYLIINLNKIDTVVMKI